MPDRAAITMTPSKAPLRGSVRPPGSKSITNRALVCAALASGTSTLTGALESEDTGVMIASLRRLGIAIEVLDQHTTLVVHGCGGCLPYADAELFVGNSGTTIRFLTAVCALGKGRYRLDGIERMRERPIGDLLDALNQLGADCQGENAGGFPPVKVNGRGLKGGEVTIRGNISSQFLSGLLMAAPYAADPVEVSVHGELVSKPYVEMTLRIMKAFGAEAAFAEDYCSGHVSARRHYLGRPYAIEPDASAASYFWAAAAVTGGEVTVEGLSRESLQGDVAFVDCLAKMGCQISYGDSAITVAGRADDGIDVDMNAISDTAQTLAVVALFAKGPTTIRGISHIRHKETDRIGDLARELQKLGATTEELPDGLRITPNSRSAEWSGATLETYNDHRMAMSLALAGLRMPGVTILNPGCTAKTYPRFFEDLARLRGTN